MKTNKQQPTTTFSIRRVILALVAVFALAIYPAATVYADYLDDQIKALQNEVNQYQIQAGNLRAQANSLQNEINALAAEQAALQVQITATEVKLQQLNEQIRQTTERIENQKTALSSNLRSVYLESEISPLEMVASSKSISDFVDRQEYRNKIRDRIQGSLKEIKQLKEELDKQKLAVERTLADQQNMRTQLAAREAERNNLLAQTQGQEAIYQQLSSQKNSEIASLRAQQRAQNLKFGGNANFQPRGGGYPSYWADPPMDSLVDDWGMYNRECVSYTAFRVAASGRHMPYWGGVGNAHQWDDNARATGIPVDTNPKVGDVVVWHIGYYGHVMYVEAVYGDGGILISEYNFDWTGRYSERRISGAEVQSQGLVFIHF